MKIYVASSWRNVLQPRIVSLLRESGNDVYDFRNPSDNNNGFHWSEIDNNWQQWTATEYRQQLSHPIAEKGFKYDFDAMAWADVCVLVLPCGRSAHVEAGWMSGQNKPTFVLMMAKDEPELMYKIFTKVCTTETELIYELSQIRCTKD